MKPTDTCVIPKPAGNVECFTAPTIKGISVGEREPCRFCERQLITQGQAQHAFKYVGVYGLCPDCCTLIDGICIPEDTDD